MDNNHIEDINENFMEVVNKVKEIDRRLGILDMESATCITAIKSICSYLSKITSNGEVRMILNETKESFTKLQAEGQMLRKMVKTDIFWKDKANG